jgi:hypothetical protein
MIRGEPPRGAGGAFASRFMEPRRGRSNHFESHGNSRIFAETGAKR